MADNLIHLKNELNKFAERRDQSKITYMPIIIKATSLALKEFPILNSSIDESFTNIIYKVSGNLNIFTFYGKICENHLYVLYVNLLDGLYNL